jgi:RNA polymerase sigma factor (sigma-70 family)
MNDTDAFHRLLAACRKNDAAAQAELVRRYLPSVLLAVRRRLERAWIIRGRFDSMDFTQEVWYSFFRIAIDRHNFACENALIAYLCEMARLKILEQCRRETAEKRDIFRTDNEWDIEGAVSNEPSPSTAVKARDEWEQLMKGLPEQSRAILEMLRDGHSRAETAAAFGLSEKTLQRMLQRLHEQQKPPVGQRP